jgi:SAM-dependent methyltransferase
MRAVDHLLRATARAESRHFWFRGFRWFVTPLIRHAIDHHPNARILDCGCGTGANLELLGRYGVTYGFDLSEVGLYIGHESGRIRLVRASVTAAPFSSEAFDLVTSFDVLYSLPAAAERAAVAEMYRLARPGGFVLINVAAMPMLHGDHSVLSHELRRYTRATLRTLVTEAGFEIVRITHTNQVLFVPMLAVRALHRWRGLSAENDAQQEIAVPAAPINAFLSLLLFVESLWRRRFDSAIGSSLLCLARKPVDALRAPPAAPRTGTHAGPDAGDRDSGGSARPARTSDRSRS